jgi:ferric-dicitrate binding protein FerR (iron transport regulator)
MGRTHDDDDAPESVRRALRRLIQDGVTPGGPDAPEVAAEFFGRADALELIQEAVVEARLARALDADTASASRRMSQRAARVRPRERPVFELHAGASRPAVASSWRNLAIAAAALLAIGVASSTIAMGNGRDGRGVQQYREASTGVAQLDTLELPDGSRAILAPNTSVRYAIDPERGPRIVALEGEAYFDVRHDDGRPFRVQTHSATVTDLGTSFLVREYAADTSALVAVRTGAASVVATAPGKVAPETMRPGDGAHVDSRGRISRFTGDPESYGAWVGGQLAFDGAPLPEVLDRLSRWYGVEFHMADPTLARQYFTGSFDAVSLPQALDILGPLVHARFEQQARLVVVTPWPRGR